MKTTAFFISFLFVIVGCSNTPPVKPEGDNVEVSRAAAKKSCRELGPVDGRTTNTKEGFDEALEDLKRDAAGRGANYVQIRKTGALGTSVRGVAYLCE